MRRELGKELRKVFSAYLQQQYPDFQLCKKYKDTDGSVLFEYKAGTLPRLFLLLFIPNKPLCDKFTIECIVVSDDSSPLSAAHTFDPKIEAATAYNFRIPRLWEGRMDHWWELSPDMDYSKITDAMELLNTKDEPIELGLARIEPQVQDAIVKIGEYVVPYFEKMRASK